MQTQKAFGKGRIELGNAKPSTHQKTLEHLSKSVRVLKTFISHVDKNRSTAIIDVEYGEVWGCWPSDIRKKFHKAMTRAGSTGTLNLTSWNRTVVETRIK